jgi:hypothetical protein
VIYLSQSEALYNVSPKTYAHHVCVKDLAAPARVNVIGICVSMPTLVIDDGTGNVMVRGDAACTIGDTVMVIGRTDMYQGKIYISADIVKKVEPEWLFVRRKELNLMPTQKEPEAVPVEKGEKEEDKVNPTSLIPLIKRLDKGGGVLIQDIVEKSSNIHCEQWIEHLIQNGDVFEIMPGKIKVLE